MEPLAIEVLPEIYDVIKYAPNSAVDYAALFSGGGGAGFVSVTRTASEISVVRARSVARCAEPASAVEGGWRALRVQGPLDFALVGIIARLAGALAGASISVFCFSTYETDYVLVKEARLDAAVAALSRIGCVVAAAGALPYNAKKNAKGGDKKGGDKTGQKKKDISSAWESASEQRSKSSTRKNELTRNARPPPTPAAAPVAPPVARFVALDAESASLDDCFRAYTPAAPAAAPPETVRFFEESDSSEDDFEVPGSEFACERDVAAEHRAAEKRRDLAAELASEFSGLVDVETILARAAPVPLAHSLQQPPARFAGTALINRLVPKSARTDSQGAAVAEPLRDNRFTPEASRLANAFGLCANRPLEPAALAQQQQLSLQQLSMGAPPGRGAPQPGAPPFPGARPGSVHDAFGPSIGGWASAQRPAHPRTR